MSKGGSDLPKRLIVAVVLIALAAGALYLGGVGFWLVTVVIGLLMMVEWAGLVKAPDGERRIAQYALSVPLASLAPIAAGASFFTFGLLMGAAFFMAAVTRRGPLVVGVIYVGLPVLALGYLRSQPDGLLLTFWAMALVWTCDSGAYFAGRAIGGAKLAPAISPNKTWAGFVGGLVAAGLFAWALGALFHLPKGLILVTPVLAILAQLGDLFESWLKRQAGVKDSGTLLPGHGGLMDRLDSLVTVAPAAALCVLIAGQLH